MNADAPAPSGSPSQNKSRKSEPRPPTAKTGEAAPKAPARVPPLFRRIDWWTFCIAFAIVWTIYFFTLAPEVTLEDSGELSTASYYAGIPHPPGYPFWTI